MKKVFFVLTLVLYACTAFSQQKIDGIGKIKLGMSQAQVREVIDSKLIKETPIESSNKENTQVEGVTGLGVTKYTPVEGYSLSDMDLLFYNDALYYIYTGKYTNIGDALSLKYGEAKVDMKEEPKKFVNGLGNTITKIDQTFTSTWETNDPEIRCSSLLSSYHNDKGEKRVITFFMLYKPSIYKVVNDALKQLKQAQKEAEKENKKNALGDL